MHRLAAVEWIDEARRGVAEGRGALISSAWSRMPRSSELVVCAAVLLSGAEDEMEAVALLLVVVAIPLSTSIVSGEVSLTVTVWGGLRSTQEWSGDACGASDNELGWDVRGEHEVLASTGILLVLLVADKTVLSRLV